MARILDTKTDGVTIGVLDKNVQFHPDLTAVTFADDAGTVHTVYAHKDGPFSSPEQIVEAWHDGTLHTGKGDDAPVQEDQTSQQQQAPPAGQVFG